MFHDINRSLCEVYTGLDPLKLLDYPAEDVFNLINGTIDYNQRNSTGSGKGNEPRKIRKQAGDNWF